MTINKTKINNLLVKGTIEGSVNHLAMKLMFGDDVPFDAEINGDTLVITICQKGIKAIERQFRGIRKSYELRSENVNK